MLMVVLFALPSVVAGPLGYRLFREVWGWPALPSLLLAAFSAIAIGRVALEIYCARVLKRMAREIRGQDPAHPVKERGPDQ